MKRLICFVLAAAFLLSLFLFASCGEKEDLSRQAVEYLKSKYDKDTFTVSEPVKDKSLSGRYELSACSQDDGIDFAVYVYPLFITDSYSVTKANRGAGEKIRSVLDAATLESVSSIVVFPVYDDGDTDFRFTTLPIEWECEMTGIDNIVLSDCDDAKAVGDMIGRIVAELKAGGITLESVRFTFGMNGYTVSITTDSDYVLSLNGEQLAELVGKAVDGAVEKAKRSENIFSDRSVKIDLNTASANADEETGATESAADNGNKR